MDAVFKICIFGDGGVGKTTLTERYLTGMFKEDMRITLGTNFYRKSLTVEGILVSLQIWDFGGEKQFHSLFPTYVIGASGAVFMYDITRFSSIKNVKAWLDLLKQGLREITIPIIMVGGKLDLAQDRGIDKESAEKVKNDNNFFRLIECSAKTGENVEQVFYDLALEMLKKADLV